MNRPKRKSSQLAESASFRSKKLRVKSEEGALNQPEDDCKTKAKNETGSKQRKLITSSKDDKNSKTKDSQTKIKLLNVPKPDPNLFSIVKTNQPLPSRVENGDIHFKDHPEFLPNMTPKEVLQAGSFGGTYFRDIYSSVVGEQYKDAWKELPSDWLEGLNIKTQVASQKYKESVNLYNTKCGGSLEMWETSGWIKKQDPYGWFQWYCRFFQGRRTKDDERQVSRWMKCAGERGRWRNNLITKIYKAKTQYDDKTISPVVRQVLLHWGYTLTEYHYKLGEKNVIRRLMKK